MSTDHEYLLMQVRNQDDPMAPHEVRCFASHLDCPVERIRTWDLLGGCPSTEELRNCDAVLLGGSGDYSVVKGGDWLEPAMTAMQMLFDNDIPTFASCWGCQAMARALGGEVRTDPDSAEVGTYTLSLTDAGQADPVFSFLGDSFPAQMGHEDLVTKLPEGAICLASSERTRNQGWMIPGKPIYCTQFHPELNLSQLLDRLRYYPKYIRKITGMDYDQFVEERCRDTNETDGLLKRFVEVVVEH